MTELETIPLTRKDFVSNQDVRWCPGCGDYAILAQVQKVMPELGVPKENIVFISGIGCSSRFPYYMDTYGMHSIHGRAPTVATGLKLANPNLKVFVITGDGDGLSIGGNHLLHAMRRNVDITIILFNNRIYGLTKGQYSPTSLPGTRTKSSPMGSIETALNPVSIAIASEATFVARSVDTHVNHLAATLKRAAEHKGVSFVEVLQNCPIFNDGAWEMVKDPKHRSDNAIYLEHGQPMRYGSDNEKGLRWTGFGVETVTPGQHGITDGDVLVHDETTDSAALAFALSHMEYPTFPIPLGVFRAVNRPSYEEGVMGQVAQARQKQGQGDLWSLFTKGDTWEVDDRQPGPATTDDGDDVALMRSEVAEEYVDTIGERQPDLNGVQGSLVDDTLAAINPAAPVTVRPSATLAEVIEQMQTGNIGCMLVTDDDNHLVGIFTERDVLNRIALEVTDLRAATVAAFMTREPRSLPIDAPIAFAVNLMATYGFRHVPVVDADNHPVGIISFRDVVRFIEQYVD